MAVVSSRQDIKSEATPFGARVHGDGIEDLVFRDPAGIIYNAEGFRFEGTAGIVRKNGLALFHGKRIAMPDLSIETGDADLGISASITGDSVAGVYHATHSTSVRIQGRQGAFYVDGARQSMETLPQGTHRWEITAGAPTPLSPAVLRTENRGGGARVLLTPVASASQYRFFISKDNAQTWTAAGESTQPEITLTGLTNDTKVHIRAVAVNAAHRSEPGDEYPIYVTGAPPLPPEGLHLALRRPATEITWGEVLGVSEYRLYARYTDGPWQLIFHGLQRSFTDGAHASAAYRVTAVNGNGEGAASRIADNDPASWRNFDPKPGEPFRRTPVGANYYPH